jgi:hypothetical protein
MQALHSSASPLSALPSAVQQTLFTGAVKAGLSQLSSLPQANEQRYISSTSSSSSNTASNRLDPAASDAAEVVSSVIATIGRLRLQRVRELVGTRGALPLLFPRFELGYTYASSAVTASIGHTPITATVEDGDTAPYVPRIELGHRLPHVWLSSSNRSTSSSDTMEMLSTLDLVGSSSVAHIVSKAGVTVADSANARVGPPCFLLLVFAGADACIWEMAADTATIPVAVVAVATSEAGVPPIAAQSSSRAPRAPKAAFMDSTGELRRLWREASLGTDGCVLVRPDGHVAWLHAGLTACVGQGHVAPPVLELHAALDSALLVGNKQRE